ncbi:MAG: type II secretion system F family protein [Clostridiaceae bacterium]|jgi:tight adherence protein C|nr:type II secretion system F family protein [Clostridiaceae bacterium]
MIPQLCQSGKYKEFLEPVDRKQYYFKPILAGGLWIEERLRLKGSGRYFGWLHQKIVMLNGSRYAAFHMKIHWASKILYLFLGIILAGLLGFLGGAEGEEWYLIVPGAGVGLFFLADKMLDDQYRKKVMSIKREFPDFVSGLVLLVNAGLSTRQAIERIVRDRGCETPLYRELFITLNDIRGGLTEHQAYTDFSERCKIKEITNFVGILLQSMKLGGGQMLYELKRLGTECWDMRKNTAKQLGETASSRLMLPLMIMFVAIIMICMMPALMELSNSF